MEPQPSLNKDRSYPVLGALPLTANLARIVVALGCAAVTPCSTAGVITKAKARRLAVANLLALEKLNDFVHERIDLMLGIATPS